MYRPGQAKGAYIGFNAGSAESIIPGANNTFDLGSSGVQWRNLYVATGIYASYLTPGRVTYVDTSGLLNADGNFLYNKTSRYLTIDSLVIEGTTATGGYDRVNGGSSNGFIFQGNALLFNPAGNTRGRWTSSNGIILSNSISVAASTALSCLDIVDSFGAGIRRITGNRTLDNTDYTIIADATSGNITITLPAANSTARRLYNIKKIDSSANTVTVTRAGSDTIDGAVSVVLTTQYQSISIQSEGANNAWWKI